MSAPRPGRSGNVLTPLSFRCAQPSDTRAVVELVESAYRGDSSRAGWTTEADLLDGQRTDREQVGTLVEDPQARLLLACAEQALVGCVLIQSQHPGVAHIGMFAVRPELQARGIGRTLLERAERLARELFAAAHAEMSVIEQRADILAWYQRLGYRLTGATEPFPYGNPRFGLPRRADLRFLVLQKALEPV